jgi:hypothetical protein
MAVELRENIGLLEEVPISHVFLTLKRPNFTFLPRIATAFDALDAFDSFVRRGLYLNAILITDTGSASQRQLGIVTVADMPQILASMR